MSIGVYMIANLRTGKYYIGSSKNIERRLYNHFLLLKHGNHHSSKLQNAYDMYGQKSFYSAIIRECSIGELHGCERRYLFDKRPEYNMKLPSKL